MQLDPRPKNRADGIGADSHVAKHSNPGHADECQRDAVSLDIRWSLRGVICEGRDEAAGGIR